MKTNALIPITKVWNTYEQYQAHRPVEIEANPTNQLSGNIYCPGENYSYLFEFPSRSLTNLSPSMAEILGIDPDNYSLQDHLLRIHPDDFMFTTRCENQIWSFLFEDKPKKSILKYKFTYCYRIRTSNDQYRLILHQSQIMSHDGFGRVSKILNVDTIVDHLFPKSNGLLSIIGLDGEASHYNIDVSADNAVSDQTYVSFTTMTKPFSLREMEVISLFAAGHTAKTASTVLGLSTGTIRTHRQNVLQKSGCNNMTELVAKCIREGLIS